MTKVFLMLASAIILVNASPAAAQTSCALKIVVDTTHRFPVDFVLVELLEQGGHVVANGRTSGDTAEFCDFEPTVRSIRVGANQCFPTSINNVRFLFGRTQVLHVFLNDCVAGGSLSNSCEVVFRIRSSDGRPLTTAVLEELGRAQKADAFGRAASRFLIGSERTYTVRAAGYRSKTVTLVCELGMSFDEVVKLESDP